MCLIKDWWLLRMMRDPNLNGLKLNSVKQSKKVKQYGLLDIYRQASATQLESGL